MKNNFRAFFVLCLAAALFAGGCKKKETQDIDNETQSSADYAIADQEFISIVQAVYQCALHTPKIGGTTGAGCDSLVYIKGDTLFGASAHVDPKFYVPLSACSSVFQDGKTRTDSLFVTLTGKLGGAATKLKVSMKGYKSNGITYACESMEMSALSTSATSAVLSVKLVNGRCENSNFLIRYNSERTATCFLTGSDLYSSVFGTFSGTNRAGRGFTGTIPEASPLVKHANCEFISQGTMELIPEGYSARTVDFGDGTCDINATFSVNGNTLAFKLK